MLSLRPIRRFCNSVAAVSSTNSSTVELKQVQTPKPKDNNKTLEEPALIKLKAERDPERLFHLFQSNAHNRLVIENIFAFEDTVSRLAGANRFDYIEKLLEQQKTLPQGRREGFIVRIIMLYGKAGMIKHAIDTFKNMHLYGCKRTVKSFNAALKVLTQTHDLEAIEAFIADMSQQFDIVGDIYSVNIAVKAFCEIGLLEKAYLTMVEVEKLGIKPDVVTYTTLISAFYKNKRSEIGNGLWNLMVRKGCLPNTATFNVRIQYLVNRTRAYQANDLMKLMPHLHVMPDEVSYNLVIKGFCRAGNMEMAKRVYYAMHHKGYKANVKIYQTMIHYLCEAEDFDLAYTMCNDCMKKNWYLNVDTICSLVEGLKETYQYDKANKIIGLAQKRKPPISSYQLE